MRIPTPTRSTTATITQIGIDLRIAFCEMQHADARQIRPLLQAILSTDLYRTDSKFLLSLPRCVAIELGKVGFLSGPVERNMKIAGDEVQPFFCGPSPSRISHLRHLRSADLNEVRPAPAPEPKTGRSCVVSPPTRDTSKDGPKCLHDANTQSYGGHVRGNPVCRTGSGRAFDLRRSTAGRDVGVSDPDHRPVVVTQLGTRM